MQNNHFVLLKTIKGLFLIHLRHWKAYFNLSLILTSKSEVFWHSEQKVKMNIFSHWPLRRLIFILHHSCKNKSCYQKSKASNYQISLNYTNSFKSYIILKFDFRAWKCQMGAMKINTLFSLCMNNFCFWFLRGNH